MGWFSRKRSSSDDQGKKAAPEPFVVDDQLAGQVAVLIDRFAEAVGNFDRELAVAGDISSAAGIHSFEQMLEMNNSDDAMHRPWRMLAAVAQRAAQQGNYALGGKIWGFTYYSNEQIFPNYSRADWVDCRMFGCPDAIKTEIAAIAPRSLLQLPTSQVIMSNAGGSLDAGVLALAAATALTAVTERGVAVDAADLAAARSVLARNVLGQG